MLGYFPDDRKTHSKGGEVACGLQRPDATAAFDNVDGTNVISIYDASTDNTAKELADKVARNFPPGEIPESRKCYRHRRVDMSARNTTRDPNSESRTDRPRKTDGEIVL